MKVLLLTLLSLFSTMSFAATDPKTAYSLVKNGKAVIIDVREEAEVKSGMIDKALWFPMSKINSDKNWKKDFTSLVGDKKIFLHCRSGARSERVMNTLKENGIPSENIGGYESLKRILPVHEIGIK